ncbi:MAG: RICIN domain-containing protein [Oscillospiraceae bacterium]|nr:RICIN domain-containing protein [Oscillospiraceae bacterium]
MKNPKKASKIIAIFMIAALCLPFAPACGAKEDSQAGAENDAATESSPEPETPAPTEPTPIEPPTEKETEPPTDPPTDPAELPAPDVIGKSDSNDGYEIIPGARYYIWSPNSNLYLTADGDYKYAGLSQDDYTGKPDQMFVFEKVREDVTDDGTVTCIYKIRALGTKESYVDIDEGADGVADGQGVVLTSSPESEGSQEWVLKLQKKSKLEDDDKVLLDDFGNIDLPLFSVTNPVAKRRVLDVSGVSKNAGGLIHMWSGGTANNQKWFFELVADVESGKIVPRGLQELDY